MLPITGQVHQKTVWGFTIMTNYIILATGSWLGYSTEGARWLPQILTSTQRSKKRICCWGFAQIQYMRWVDSYLKLSHGMKRRVNILKLNPNRSYRMVPHDIPKEEEIQERSGPSWLQSSETIMVWLLWNCYLPYNTRSQPSVWTTKAIKKLQREVVQHSPYSSNITFSPIWFFEKQPVRTPLHR